MTSPLVGRMAAKPLLMAALLALVAALVVAPTGFGLPTGANKDTIQVSDFASKGCVSCHGGGKFTEGGSEIIHWTITDPDGKGLAGNTYVKGTAYRIHIKLDKQNIVEGAAADRIAGFNLRASAGKLSAPLGEESNILPSTDGTQATHKNAQHTQWNVTWTAPDSGLAVFDLFVNDVNGIGGADAGDQVHRVGFWLTDAQGTVPGAVVTEVKEFGISLQQYWIGLIGLAGMIFVMIAGYVFLKYGSSHNTDEKDR